jgi:hypothetical protein
MKLHIIATLNSRLENVLLRFSAFQNDRIDGIVCNRTRSAGVAISNSNLQFFVKSDNYDILTFSLKKRYLVNVIHPLS